MDRVISPWTPGANYGPILSQTDLYLLGTKLELNPILEGKLNDYQLQFHLVTGFATNNATGDNSVVGKEEPATLPRVTQLVLISKYSPWCTIVKKDTGVTIGDICSAIFKDYSEHDVTDAEFKFLNARAQDQLRRTAAVNFSTVQQPNQPAWAGYYNSPQGPGPDRLRRVDWLRDRVYFEGLSRDDNYIQGRLGFKAPNLFVMELTS